MSFKPEITSNFAREQRYIVVKRKHLSVADENEIFDLLAQRSIATTESVVVESKWPEYEAVWKMIEKRCSHGKMMKEEHRCVVRLSTSIWQDKSGVHIKRTLRTLKRLSTGYDILKEDSIQGGANAVIPLICNLDACKDGIYQLTYLGSLDTDLCTYDIYGYKLIPF